MGGRAVDDGNRPLLAEGLLQAKELVGLLSAFSPNRVITSPWNRCRTTVVPYAEKRKIKIIERSQLSELGNKKAPKRTTNVIDDIVQDGRATVICSHRPALPTILEALERYASAKQKNLLQAGTDLKPAEMLVVQMTTTEKRKVVSVERYGLK